LHLDIGNGVSLEKVDKFYYLGDIYFIYFFLVHVQISSFHVTTEGVSIGKQHRAAVSIFGF